ncbi:MAG: [Fe-S]-binding protein [Deltaproteobacteria bacterium]|nr:MAG: [Fe-S]-binding protein [Deltaproteobacteria bacterium]
MTERLIRVVRPEINHPSLQDNTADTDRVVKALKKHLGVNSIDVDFSLIKELPYKLRDNSYKICACIFQTNDIVELIDVYPAEGTDIYGIAIDLGSSTIVMDLIRLNDLKNIDEVTFRNPQIEIGTDILTRIHYASKPEGLNKLQSMLIDEMNKHIQQLCDRHNISTDTIVGISVAGNTSMTHLFLGLTPQWICREPYIPVINKFERPLKAYQVGLKANKRAMLIVFPNVGSYFGGDLIAGILASGMARQNEEICMLVDVGTNAEVVLGNGDWLIACAGAAGPALEGGVANIGMMAGPGVIDRVKIDPETLEIEYHTIDDLPPVGICGSGLIDLVAQMFIAGMIDMRGKFVPERCGNRLVEKDGIMYFIVVPAEESGTGEDLTLSQPDIDSLIRSKAAMYTILTTIINTVNLSFNDIGKFYIAGTFGSYINPQSAITIGMIPDLPLDTYVALGNTSIKGASLIFKSQDYYEEMLKIRDMITYIELNVNQEFMQLFSAAKFIPHTDRSLFPSVKQYNEK